MQAGTKLFLLQHELHVRFLNCMGTSSHGSCVSGSLPLGSGYIAAQVKSTGTVSSLGLNSTTRSGNLDGIRPLEAGGITPQGAPSDQFLDLVETLSPPDFSKLMGTELAQQLGLATRASTDPSELPKILGLSASQSPKDTRPPRAPLASPSHPATGPRGLTIQMYT